MESITYLITYLPDDKVKTDIFNKADSITWIF